MCMPTSSVHIRTLDVEILINSVAWIIISVPVGLIVVVINLSVESKPSTTVYVAPVRVQDPHLVGSRG